jgi:hypothetical protein
VLIESKAWTMTVWEWFKLLLPIACQGLFITITYTLAIRQFRMARASSFLERFLSSDMTRARMAVDKLCEGAVDEMVKALRDGASAKRDDLLSQVRMFANFFQELGIAYRHGLVHRTYTEEIFDFLVKSYWDRLQPWIEDYRTQKNDRTLYSKWHDLAVAFKHKDNQKAR